MLAVSGPLASAIGSAFGVGEVAQTVWSIARWPIILVLMILAAATLYYATLNVGQPKFRWISVGAGVAIITWLVASALFGVHVANFSNYNRPCCALAGVIVFSCGCGSPTWGFCSVQNSMRSSNGGVSCRREWPPSGNLQLPARDTRVVEKNEAEDEQDWKRARALRESRGKNH
jgi:membrane protein